MIYVNEKMGFRGIFYANQYTTSSINDFVSNSEKITLTNSILPPAFLSNGTANIYFEKAKLTYNFDCRRQRDDDENWLKAHKYRSAWLSDASSEVDISNKLEIDDKTVIYNVLLRYNPNEKDLFLVKYDWKGPFIRLRQKERRILMPKHMEAYGMA
jgi:hypothetical protein